jgi:hypothetical protein
MATQKKKITKHLGNQPPRYRFFFNPYRDMRCTKCPQCDRKMHQRKLPLMIHIYPRRLLSLNKTCRYCPHCDLLIAHQNDVEGLLTTWDNGAGRLAAGDAATDDGGGDA